MMRTILRARALLFYFSAKDDIKGGFGPYGGSISWRGFYSVMSKENTRTTGYQNMFDD